MERWTLQRYREPRLRVDAIEHDDGSAVVDLRARGTAYRIAVDHAAAAAQIAAELRGLADSTAPLWQTLRTAPPDSNWHALGTFLDARSLIGEARDDAAEALAAQRRSTETLIDDTARAIVEPLAPARRARLATDARSLRAELSRGDAAFDADDPFDAAVRPNFYLALLAIEFAALRRSAPPTLAACDRLLARLAGDDTDAAPCEMAGVYDPHDLAARLWLAGCALAAAGGDDAARYATAPLPEPALRPGLEFLRQTELVARATLAGWGDNPYVAALERGGASAALVAGRFVEQYHVTRRFVEIVAPLLSMRLAPPLRTQLFRYYGEEVGHEAFESATCEALGVAPAQLAQTLPLPLLCAFVDVLTLLAERDPVASFAALMVAEGIYGEPPRVVAHGHATTAGSGEHEALNESLNHDSLARDLFAPIAALGPERQARALRRFLFVLELNQRAWGEIARFYGAQPELRLHGPFGRPLAPA